jgi:LytS/YehU family sensor histidine kinase
VITIYNDGPSVRPDWKTGSGIGLRNTIERLSLLYGEKSRLELANFQGGVRLSVRIPLLVGSKSVDIHEAFATSAPAHPGVM